MECGADGTRGGVELLDHTFDLLTETCLVEIETKHILAAVELLQTTPVLIVLTYLERGYDGLQLCQHGIGRGLEGTAVVVDAFQITGIACEGEGDQHEVRLVETTGDILLQGLSADDG